MQNPTSYRILRATVLAGLAALTMATHVFVAIDRIRVKVVEAPTAATAAVVRATTVRSPAANELRSPFALIARINSQSAERNSFSISVDGASVCKRDVAGGGSRRVDCAVAGPWNPRGEHEVAIQGPATPWTLEYLELATHHGNTDGAHYLVVLPAASDHYARPAFGWVIATFLLLTAAILLLPAAPPLPGWVRVLYRVVVGVVVLELAVSQISQWISDYRIVVSAGTFARLLILPFIPRLWVAGRTSVSAFFKRYWSSIYQPGIDAAPAPGQIRWQTRVLVGLAMAAFGAVFLHAQLWHMDSVPDKGDPLFSVWRLGWVYNQMLGDPRSLFDANIFHPARLTLTFSDSTLLPAVMNAPLLAAGVHPVTAYNVILVGSFLASAFTCYLLVEELTGSTAAGFIAGLLFGFYPFRFEHYSHLELLMGYWIPLSLFALHRFVATAKVRYAVLAALMAVAQLYSSMYLAVFYLLVAAVMFGLLLWLTRPDVRALARGAVIAGVLALALAFPLSNKYTSAHLKERDVGEVAVYSADLSDYLRAELRSTLWAGRTLPNTKPERALFPGLMILVLAAVALVPPLGATRIAYAGALVFSVELSRGYNSFLYLGLYETLSFMRGIRSPARASLLVGLTLAVLAGFAVRRLIAHRSRVWSAGIVGALTVLIGVDLYPTLFLEPVWPEPPPIYQALGDRRDAVLAEFPLGLSPGAGLTDIPQMYFSLWHWNQIVDGYSGHGPEGYGDFQRGMQSFPSEPSLELLRARGVTHVTVNCALYVTGCETLLKEIEAVADLRLLVSATWEGKPVRLYALKP
jgi:hypothetical protein